MVFNSQFSILLPSDFRLFLIPLSPFNLPPLILSSTFLFLPSNNGGQHRFSSFVILTPLLGEGGEPEGRGGYSPLWNVVPCGKMVERFSGWRSG